MNSTFEKIFEHVRDIEIIDTHEHLSCFENEREKNTDFLKEYLTDYFNRDLISAGLSKADYEKAIDIRLPLMERWKIVEPFWNVAKHTGYGRGLDNTVNGLYGIDSISGRTLEQLNHEFLKTLNGGQYETVFKKKSKIKIALLDGNLKGDPAFFRNVFRVDSLIWPATGDEVKEIEKASGIRICGMDDWLNACDTILENALKAGFVGFKHGLAYKRTLSHERATKDEAEKEFNKIFAVRHWPNWCQQTFDVGKKFQDYMMHHILRFADKREFPFQIHTGLQNGHGNLIYNAEPSLLSNLFLEYPGVKFDVFHIGYPYQHVLSALAKTFPNVHIDMCWAHIISPTACVNALVEWIDAVPINKISAFGGDHCFIDGVYGHQYLARVNVSKALAIKVDDGVFDIDRAKEIAEFLFYKNPLRLFNLQDKL